MQILILVHIKNIHLTPSPKKEILFNSLYRYISSNQNYTYTLVHILSTNIDQYCLLALKIILYTNNIM
jgi:hypothetical protein